MLTRAEWGATAPLSTQLVAIPVTRVFLHHSVTTATADVAADMRDIEAIGVQRFGRFSYSFCGHPNGTVAEGAGLTVGAHTSGYNSTSFGFCLIGNYEGDVPTDAQIAAFGQWWRDLVALGWIHPEAELIPHRHVKATACPGAQTIARFDEFVAATQGDPVSESQVNDIHFVTVGARRMANPAAPPYVDLATLVENINHHVQVVIPAAIAQAKAEILAAIAAIPASTGSGATADEVADEIAQRLAE
jgi:hypothetical protein